MVAFGTGGTEGSDFEAMEEIFYNPEAYDCMGYENVWDEGASRNYLWIFYSNTKKLRWIYR
jgi:hypothetical protein